MEEEQSLPTVTTNRSLEQRVFWLLGVVLAIILCIVLGEFFFPVVTSFILSVFWFVFLSMIITFGGVAILVVFGLRQQANQVLDMFLEGSLSVVDGIEFLREIWKSFWSTLGKFLLFISPYAAYVVALILYLALLLLYKFVGKSVDVSVMTVVLTAALIGGVGFYNYSGTKKSSSSALFTKASEKFRLAFSDGLEVVIFMFFLTMDSTALFFLPANLNIELHASVFGYNLMERGFILEGMQITLTIVMVAVGSEILRNIMRLLYQAVVYYRQHPRSESRSLAIKQAIRTSFRESRDDTVKFITFTSILVGVFLLFPRLKLLSMAVASVTSFVLDVLMPQRMLGLRHQDLIARVLSKVVPVN